jgi:hypothetical protein
MVRRCVDVLGRATNEGVKMTHGKYGTYLRRDDTARRLGIPVGALDAMRAMRVGPRALYFSHHGCVYRPADLVAWLGQGGR